MPAMRRTQVSRGYINKALGELVEDTFTVMVKSLSQLAVSGLSWDWQVRKRDNLRKLGHKRGERKPRGGGLPCHYYGEMGNISKFAEGGD